MIDVLGRINEDRLVKEIKKSIPMYENASTGICNIPFKHNGKKKYVKFIRLVEQWVFVDIFAK